MFNTILLGYAQIFFSTKRHVGLFFMAATFIIPAQGAAGLTALVLSNLWASVLGFPKEDIKSGFYGYNGLLTGLALGLTYTLNVPLVVMLLIASLLGVLVANTVQAVFRHYLLIPVLSIPFVLTTWLMLAGGRQFLGMTASTEPFDPFGQTFLLEAIPQYAILFFRSLGATFFQLSTVAGIIIACGIILFSRYAFILSIVGLASGGFVFTMLMKGNPSELYSGYIGFNFILTAIAIGGVWAVPAIDSLILAAIGSAVCALIASASTFFLAPLGLPPLAFPFVMTTSFILYALKQRHDISRFRPIATPEATPEMNLKRYRNTATRFVRGEQTTFHPPFSGTWTITQGIDGKHTHKDIWSHAWDFEIIDDAGNAFREDSSVPEDYYAYNMPVYAPADGKVINAVSHLEDNPVGQVTAGNNWGNIVILLHYGNVYSALCHLKQGTVAVNEGDVVRTGQLLGRVGSSGRSILPHLHFHAQAGPEVGAPTIPSGLLHYVHEKDNENYYHTFGIPQEGERVRPLSIERDIFDAASFPLGSSWTYEVFYQEKIWTETWQTEIDFSGTCYISCKERRARIRYSVNPYILLLMDYEGPPDTGLYWFYLGLPRLPMTAEKIMWRDELPGDLMLSAPRRLIYELVEPFFPIARLQTESRFIRRGAQFSVETRLEHLGPLARGNLASVSIASTFGNHKGLASLVAFRGEDKVIELKKT